MYIGIYFESIDECHRMLDNGTTLKDELKDLERVRADFANNDGHQVKMSDNNHKRSSPRVYQLVKGSPCVEMW